MKFAIRIKPENMPISQALKNMWNPPQYDWLNPEWSTIEKYEEEKEDKLTEDHEAKRDDDNFRHVAAWEFTGYDKEPVAHIEPLIFENVELSQRSYK